jgi:protease IV
MRRRFDVRVAALAAFALSLSAARAGAQTPIEEPVRLPALGRSVAGTDDTTALVQNPANLAFMPGAELRWSSIYLKNDLTVPWQGHAIAFGLPLPLLPLATGIRLDLLDPSAAAGLAQPFATRPYQWLTWGLAVAPSDAFALGFTLQRSYSSEPQAEALGSWSAGLSWRPVRQLGLSGVASDVGGAQNAAGGMLAGSYTLAAALRPLGSRAVELGLEGKYIDTARGVWVPRATLGVDIPPLGRLRGDFEISDPTSTARRAWIASAALAVYFDLPSGSIELAGGSLTGNGLGQTGSYNVQTDVALRGWREPAGPEIPRTAIRIRIENTPDAREHVALLRRLWQIADDEPSVDAVVFELRTAPADSLAHVEELRDAIHYLRSKGKRVLCHLEDAGGASLYMCAAADRILMNPAGGLRFAGLRVHELYFASLLHKLGIRADFVRIGVHKSAPEELTRNGPTRVARADEVDLLQQLEERFMAGVSAGRHVDVQTLRESIAKGPFVASEAKAAGLIDGYAYDDQIDDAVSSLCGRREVVVDDLAPRAPEHFGNLPQVAIVYVDGDMIDGRSRTIPLVDERLAGSYTIADALKKVRNDPDVGAVVLRIESPGGSALAADVMWRQVEITARVKPVVVSMGGYAASGGYYIASSATRIFADPLSITGSIGIFYGKVDVAQLLNKIGVSVTTFKTAPRADAESIFQPFSPDERRELKHKVRQFYDVFLSRVAQGRHMTKAAVDQVGQGRVWTGQQALARGLVDQLGGLRQALDYARRAAGLPSYAPIEELPPSNTTWLGRLLGIEGVHVNAVSALPPAVMDLARDLSPFVVYSGDRPLARLDMTPIKP